MKVDNSGATHIFDKKTQETIEEAKNRLTNIAVEEQRLKKLKASYEADLITVGAAIEYKTSLLEQLTKDIEVAQSELKAIHDEHAVIVSLDEKTKDNIEKSSKDLESRELACVSKEKELKEKESAINKREKAVDKKESDLIIAKEEFTKKKTSLEKVIQSL